QEYTFKHALTHEVAYEGLLVERRRILHAGTMAALERLYAERLPEHMERLAHHAFRGEMWEKAVAYYRQAGIKAFTRSAVSESVSCFEKALAALGHRPETRDTLEQAIDLRLDLRPSLYALGQVSKMVDHLREAEGLATKLNDPRRLGWVSAHS